jgi:hypothetical protein
MLIAILGGNPVYSRRVDGFEYAYKVMTKQLPGPLAELWDNPFDDPFNSFDGHILHQKMVRRLEALGDSGAGVMPQELAHQSESEGPCPSVPRQPLQTLPLSRTITSDYPCHSLRFVSSNGMMRVTAPVESTMRISPERKHARQVA